MRRSRVALFLLVPSLFVLTACSTLVASHTTVTGATVQVSSTPAPPGRVVAVSPDMSVTVPEGWRVLRSANPAPSAVPASVCLVPPGPAHDCTGVGFEWGPDIAGPNGAPYKPDQNRGWYNGTFAWPCLADVATGTAGPLRPTRPTDSGHEQVGSHSAAWNRWHETCRTGGREFDPQVWFLADDEVLVRDLGNHAETSAVLASAEFRGDGADVPNAAVYKRVRVASITTSHAVVRFGGQSQRVALDEAICTRFRSLPGDLLAVAVPCGRLGAIAGGKAFDAVIWTEPDGTLDQLSLGFRSGR